MSKHIRLLPLAVALLVAGCFTPANYGEGVAHEGEHKAEQKEPAAKAEEAAEPVIEGVIPGTEGRKLDMETPRIDFEPPFDGEPISKTTVANDVLVEDFAVGTEGDAVADNTIVEYHFKAYQASTSRMVGGSRMAPTRLLISQASRDAQDPGQDVKIAIMDGLMGAKAGTKRRLKIPAAITGKSNPPGRPAIGDVWVTVEVVSVKPAPVLAKADQYSGDPIAKGKTDTGVETFDYRAGEGPKAEKGKQVVAHYIGQLDDSTVFDSSHGRADALTVILGAGGVIPGLDAGLMGAQKGMLRKVVIPADQGYGDRNMGKIPPNSRLTFLVEIVEVGDAPQMPAMPMGPGGPGGNPPPPRGDAPKAEAPKAEAPKVPPAGGE